MDQAVHDRILRLFKRNRFAIYDIKYITHSDQRTLFSLLDGREVMTALPLKAVAAQLPPNQFWSIQKGVVVSARHVLSIDDNGLYTMVDGRQFQGRTRNPAEHKRRRQQLQVPSSVPDWASTIRSPQDLLEQCSLLERAPIAFCLIQMEFAPDGHSIDFIFRYCNHQMEDLEGIPAEKLLGCSFFEIFPDAGKKWIVPFADVALNGTDRTIQDYSPAMGHHLYIRCYQPQPGYCACLVEVDQDAEK